MPAIPRCSARPSGSPGRTASRLARIPGFPISPGFGRRDMRVTPRGGRRLHPLSNRCRRRRGGGRGRQRCSTSKPTGRCSTWRRAIAALAGALARAVAAFDPALLLFAPPGSEMALRRARRSACASPGGVCRSRVRSRRPARIATEGGRSRPRCADGRRTRRRPDHRACCHDARRLATRSWMPTRSAFTAIHRARTDWPPRFAPGSRLPASPSNQSEHPEWACSTGGTRRTIAHTGPSWRRRSAGCSTPST